MHDLRYALRGLARSPGFAIAAILTLALGIGAVTSIFSVADAVLLRPLPYPQSDRLVMVWEQLRSLNIDKMPPRFDTMGSFSTQPVFDSTAAVRLIDGTLTGAGEAARIVALEVSPDIFPILGVTPVIGRAFTEDESRHGGVAILTHTFFVKRFGGDASVVGRSVALNDRSLTITGVLPAGFAFIYTGSLAADLWIPIQPSGRVDMLARVRSGVSLGSAQSAMDAAAKHFDETAHPYRGPHGEDAGYRVKVSSLRDEILGSFRTTALVLMCAVAAVLLIACVNVANLLLVRAVAREKEFAVRRALGASPARLARQWLTEAAVIVAIGGTLGAIAAGWGVRLLIALNPVSFPGNTSIRVDGRALLFTLAISAAICLVFSLAPAVTKRDGGTRSRGASTLVAVEAALAVMLLIGAGLLSKSFVMLTHVDTGFNSQHLLTMQVELHGPQYPEQRQIEFYTKVREQIAALPAVISATASSRLPVNIGANMRGGSPFSIEGRAWDPSGAVPQLANTQITDGEYFRTLQIPVAAGRGFNDTDTASAPFVAVVNETLARGFFPRGDAIGRRILLGAPQQNSKWLTIVGVVRDVKAAALDQPALPQFYTPLSQHASQYMELAIRTAGDPTLVARQAAAVVRAIEPGAPVYGVQTMEERVARTVSQPRFESAMLGFFAAAALFLAAIGIFGVVAHSVARRTKEIGIRMALGADRAEVVGPIVSHGLRPVAIGMITGVVAALAISRAISSVLFHVAGYDPQIILVAIATLLLVAIAACLIPARRASRIDPMHALRSE